MNTNIKNELLYVSGVILVIVISLSFILPDLGSFLTADEPRWIAVEGVEKTLLPENYDHLVSEVYGRQSYARSEAYWDAYLTGNFRATLNSMFTGSTLNFLHLPAYLLKHKLNYQQYLIVARSTIIAHNFLLLLLLFFLFKKITSKKRAFLFFTLFALLPQFIGYSRIINHDAFQGLYVLIFIISIWIALQNKNKNYYILAGIFYAAALFTQFKSVFIQPLLWTLPILYLYIKNDLDSIKTFFKNLPIFFISAITTSIVLLPAVLFYPSLIFERLFLYHLSPAIFWVVLVVAGIGLGIMFFSGRLSPILNKIKNKERWFVVVLWVCLLMIFIVAVVNSSIFSTYINSGVIKTVSWDFSSIIGLYSLFVFSLPISIVILFLLAIFSYFKNKKINFPFMLLVLFFVLILLAAIIAPNLFTGRYLYVFIPIFIAGLALSDFGISEKFYPALILIVAVSLIIGNLQMKPFYTLYNNYLLPKGMLIDRTTWGTDIGEVAEYINNNLNNTIVYAPKGDVLMNPFIKDEVQILPWFVDFWKFNPSYIVVSWEKTHKYHKIFDYYRENEQPLWSIERNGAEVTGLYRFNKDLDYQGLLLE